MSTLQVTNIKATGETASRAVSGVAAAWVNFNGTGTAAIRDSVNVASLTDNGTGDFTVNFSNNMDNDDYAFAGSGCGESAPTATIWCTPEQVSGFLTSSITVTIGFTNPTATNVRDYEGIGVTTHGDLA